MIDRNNATLGGTGIPAVKMTDLRKRQVNCQAYDQTGVLMSTSLDHCKEWQGEYCSGCPLTEVDEK